MTEKAIGGLKFEWSIKKTGPSEKWSDDAKQILDEIEISISSISKKTMRIISKIDDIRLPVRGEQLRIRTQRQLNMISFLVAIVKNHGFADEVIISTYTINKEAFSILTDLIKSGRVKKLTMGETAAKLRQIFDMIRSEDGVYLFDEFDAICGVRRVPNAFLRFVEQDDSDSIIVAATNKPGLIDHALFRRFDDVLCYGIPSRDDRQRLIENVLGTFKKRLFEWKEVLNESMGMSHADIVNACRDAIKNAILNGVDYVNATQLSEIFKERKWAT